MKRAIDAGPDDCGVLVDDQERWTGGFYVCGEPLPCREHPTPHCPDCRCVAACHEAFCYLCGAGIHHVPEDCAEGGEFCPGPSSGP